MPQDDTTPTTEREPLLRTRAVAKALNVERQTVVLWIKDGKIRAAQTPGGQYRIPQSELDRLLAEVA